MLECNVLDVRKYRFLTVNGRYHICCDSFHSFGVMPVVALNFCCIQLREKTNSRAIMTDAVKLIYCSARIIDVVSIFFILFQ